MSHKSGHIIINALLPENGVPRLSSLTNEQCERLNEIRARDQYNPMDRLFLGMLVASIADDPAD
jgi:hypothetical protein